MAGFGAGFGAFAEGLSGGYMMGKQLGKDWKKPEEPSSSNPGTAVQNFADTGKSSQGMSGLGLPDAGYKPDQSLMPTQQQTAGGVAPVEQGAAWSNLRRIINSNDKNGQGV